ncbi:MAG: hypothetical protein KJ571_07025 [Bacteroidetes bacterium]|nr:hypothetical protein [Bacteroidota bacterium]
MGEVSLHIIEEIENIAKEYMTDVKGTNLTKADLMIAENLIMFGYLRAKNEIEKNFSNELNSKREEVCNN